MERRGEEAEHPTDRGGPVGDPIRGLCPRFKSLAMGNEYGGMADGSAVNGKHDGTGCTGMARCPLTAICSRYP